MEYRNKGNVERMNYLEVIKMLYDLEIIETFKMTRKSDTGKLKIIDLEDDVGVVLGYDKDVNSIDFVYVSYNTGDNIQNKSDHFTVIELKEELYKKQMGDLINE
jgi:hypothetical protein